MNQLAHGRLVTAALMAGIGNGMVDRFRGMSLGDLAQIMTPLGVLIVIVLEVVRALTANNTNTYDLGQIKAQIQELRQLEQNQNSDLSDKINKLQDQFNNGPRPDQLLNLERHLSAIDGRLDGLDTRLRGDETDLTRAKTQIDGIDQASKAQLLPGRR